MQISLTLLLTLCLEFLSLPIIDCRGVHIFSDGLVYFDGLLEGESLSSSLLMLETYYHEAIHEKGELDERMFVNEEDSLLGSGGLSGGFMNLSGTKSPAKSMTSPLSSVRSCAVSVSNGNMVGHNLKAVATPVSTAMVTAKWLRTVMSPLDSVPSVELQRYLHSCHTDLKHEVMYRAHVIMGAIFPFTQTGIGAAGKLHNPELIQHLGTTTKNGGFKVVLSRKFDEIYSIFCGWP